jgi:maleylpyruvate isomerase
MKLYSYFRSSSSYRVRVALAIKGIPYAYVPVNLAPGAQEQLSAEFERVNPLRQIPVLVWSEEGREIRLTQSVAIIEYLEERWPQPPLLPVELLARARVREAVEIVNAGIQPLQNPSTLSVLRQAGGRELEHGFRQQILERGLGSLEQLAAAHRGPFFAGESVSMADLFIVPQLLNARRYHVDLAPFARLLDLERAALAHPAFRAAAPLHQPDTPPDLKE